ncbi:MAG: helix-turn-helix domain-containing protein [Actinomycetota bacterium]|nr:helix-turn-helix domain-containing protein [Actinomycetota bacterium]
MARESTHVLELRRALGSCLAACRQQAQWSQGKFADEMHYHRTAISHLEAGRHPAPRDFWVRADTVLGAKGALIAAYEAVETARQDAARREGSAGGLPAVPVEDGTMQRREAFKLGLAVAVTPEVLGRVLSEAAAEAMEFTQFTGLSAVGQDTLEHLDLVVSDLHRVYLKDPPAEQFVVARAYRSRADELIRGRHTLKELQALYVYAAWLSELLAWLAHDLGNSRTAQAYALDCYTYADEAGHDELCGWAANAMASIAMYSERPDSAARAAMQGVVKVSTSHPLAVSLRAHAARAYARLGQREPCETLFDEAQQLHERLPARAPCRFAKDTGIIASYAITAYPASAYLWLRDFETARRHGEAALAAIESAPPGSREQRQSFAQLILATALVGLGTPDEAVALGTQALMSTRVVTSGVVAYARDLDRALVSRYPRLACVREFHEQYRQVAQHLTAAEGGS